MIQLKDKRLCELAIEKDYQVRRITKREGLSIEKDYDVRRITKREGLPSEKDYEVRRITRREGLRREKDCQVRRITKSEELPSEKDYQGMVSSNMIENCPISTSDVSNAHVIFGPDLASVRGKTVR